MKIVPEKSQDLSTEVLELDEVNKVSLCLITMCGKGSSLETLLRRELKKTLNSWLKLRRNQENGDLWFKLRRELNNTLNSWLKLWRNKKKTVNSWSRLWRKLKKTLKAWLKLPRNQENGGLMVETAEKSRKQ